MKCNIDFPVSIGDTVRAFVEDENHIVELIEYKVCGLAQIGNKQFVLDEQCEKYEIGKRLCILKEN